MNIKDEFEKAIAPRETIGGLFHKEDIYFAAAWMAERCLKIFDSHSNVAVIENEIRQLAKELSQ